MLEDVPLLAIRAAIVAAAVAALAGPLIVTRTQRQAWNARVVRATVVDDVARAASASARNPFERATVDKLQPPAFCSQTFETPAVADAIPRAVAWLENAPPARRELVIVGPLALGSVSADDLGSRYLRTSASGSSGAAAAGRAQHRRRPCACPEPRRL